MPMQVRLVKPPCCGSFMIEMLYKAFTLREKGKKQSRFTRNRKTKVLNEQSRGNLGKEKKLPETK